MLSQEIQDHGIIELLDKSAKHGSFSKRLAETVDQRMYTVSSLHQKLCTFPLTIPWTARNGMTKDVTRLLMGTERDVVRERARRYETSIHQFDSHEMTFERPMRKATTGVDVQLPKLWSTS